MKENEGKVSMLKDHKNSSEYQERIMNKEEVMGYIIAAIDAELSYLESVDQAAFLMEIERQFEILSAEEARGICVERWPSGSSHVK